MWNWYVYELADPRTGEAFYVGKGCRNRISQHEKDARNPKTVCSEKINKIKEIWDAGFEVEKRHVAFFRREQDAYAYEAERVGFYGLDALTNIVPGGGGCRGYVISRPKPEKPMRPWTALVAAETFVKSDRMMDCLAVWLKAVHHRRAIDVYMTSKLVERAVVYFFQKMLPSIWELIKTDREAVEMCRPGLSARGVEVVYGSA